MGNAKRANGYKGESTDGRPQGGYAEDGKSFAAGAKWQPCPGCPKCIPHGGYVLRKGSGRCTTAHEYIFVFAKTNRYFWDSAASAEPAAYPNDSRKPYAPGQVDARGNGHDRGGGHDTGRDAGTRNPRSVWTLSSEPCSELHFATFPSELVRRCLAAGTSGGGCCPHCGAPWAPVVDTERVATRPALNNKIWKHADGDKIGQRSDSMPNLDPERHIAVTNCLGYRQTCNCPEHKPIGSLVADPFCGIGTTGQTAIKLGNRFIGVDLNAKYLDVAAKRIFEPPRWWLREQKPSTAPKPLEEQKVLFT